MRDWLEGFRASSDSSSWVRRATQGSGNNYAQSIRVGGGGSVGYSRRFWSVEPHCAVLWRWNGIYAASTSLQSWWPFIHREKEPVWNLERTGNEAWSTFVCFRAQAGSSHESKVLEFAGNKLPGPRSSPSSWTELLYRLLNHGCHWCGSGVIHGSQWRCFKYAALSGSERGKWGGAERPKCSLTSLEKLWLGKNLYFCRGGSSFNNDLITCLSVGLIVFICWQRIRKFIGWQVVLTLSSSWYFMLCNVWEYLY